jgi:exopolysaccharide biosynthesis WecB/TagA/CpsF family protein
MTSSPPRLNVLGVGISAVTPGAAAQAVLAAARDGRPLAASALAVHAVMEAQSDEAYRGRLNSLDLACPDGQPVRWAANFLHGAGIRERVYGPFLMRDLCAAAAKEGLPVYLFGGTADLLARLSGRLQGDHPGLRIAGAQPSRFRRAARAEAESDAAAITASGARIVFCGIGCPRQEAWVHAMRPLIRAPLVGVGAAFALWARDRTMAPAWMQESGLEWLYRLCQEPRRLAGRYLAQGPSFFSRVAEQKARSHAAPIDGAAPDPDYWG